jgi:hypothetical protein
LQMECCADTDNACAQNDCIEFTHDMAVKNGA